jgi:hypothetical protein
MTGLDVFITWHKAEMDRLKREIELMESGRMLRHTLEANGQWDDTTSRELKSCKNRLIELERVLKRLEPKPDEGIRPQDLNSSNDG